MKFKKLLTLISVICMLVLSCVPVVSASSYYTFSDTHLSAVTEGFEDGLLEEYPYFYVLADASKCDEYVEFYFTQEPIVVTAVDDYKAVAVPGYSRIGSIKYYFEDGSASPSVVRSSSVVTISTADTFYIEGCTGAVKYLSYSNYPICYEDGTVFFTGTGVAPTPTPLPSQQPLPQATPMPGMEAVTAIPIWIAQIIQIVLPHGLKVLAALLVIYLIKRLLRLFLGSKK